ncbi:hypothetical protein K458DRAFT_331725 [Lentithecium fluviatile CBS 122367]|uniref:Uncharacterized protein n=1 Tax=Lentithecium fluviatile CBS 122367 TaxID=1168545 RepID=A0A6G1JBI7_9PLEO|nr:hypothetical protein K458DRAFT_331725 [Lentithecium fluviatile CBS 122367]
MKEYNEKHSPEEAAPLHTDPNEPFSRRQQKPSRRVFLFVTLLITSAALNFGLILKLLQKKASQCQADISPYVHLPRDLPIQYNSHSSFGLGSSTEKARALAWEGLDSSAGEISVDKDWADAHGLPKSAPFFWDEDQRIYLLNAHHSLHCMRKVRRAIVLYNYNRPQLDSYVHLVHCMDHLMQNIICEADDTPFYTSTTSNITTGHQQTRMCRSWDRLTEWAEEHSSCFAYINETQGVNSVIERFRYCPKGSPLLKPMRKHFGYSDDWFQKRPQDIDTLPRYWEGLD